MFNKKKCRKCGEKVNKKNRFCPNCGFEINNKSDYNDWGMLGRDDFVSDLNGFNEIKMPMGFNTLFGSLMKNLSKEFEKIDKDVLRISGEAIGVEPKALDKPAAQE